MHSRPSVKHVLEVLEWFYKLTEKILFQKRGLVFYYPRRPPPPGLVKDHTFAAFFFCTLPLAGKVAGKKSLINLLLWVMSSNSPPQEPNRISASQKEYNVQVAGVSYFKRYVLWYTRNTIGSTGIDKSVHLGAATFSWVCSSPWRGRKMRGLWDLKLSHQ